jgi:serine/threonine-protein kinase
MVVLTALRKEPERRYSSADRLGADIRRHLEGLPVSAGPDRWSYRAGKFVRRHPVGVIAAIGFVLLLAGSSVLSTVQSARTARERDKAEGLAGFLVDLLGASNPYEGRGETVTVRELLDSAVPRIERELHREPEIRAELLAVMGRAYEAMDLLERARLLLDSAVAIRRRSGNEDFDLIRDQSWLARVSWFQGHHFFAESLYRATLRTSRRRFGDRHPSSTLPLMWLGNALRQDGRWAEAESLLTQAVAIQRTHSRRGHSHARSPVRGS